MQENEKIENKIESEATKNQEVETAETTNAEKTKQTEKSKKPKKIIIKKKVEKTLDKRLDRLDERPDSDKIIPQEEVEIKVAKEEISSIKHNKESKEKIEKTENKLKVKEHQQISAKEDTEKTIDKDKENNKGSEISKEKKPKEKKKKKLSDVFIAQSNPLFTTIFTGKRKTAIARLRIHKNKSNDFLVNKIPFDVYFSRKLEQQIVKQALLLISAEDKYSVYVNVQGGGKTGQAEAIRLALARAFSSANTDFHKALRNSGLLTRDSRIVERKKYGFRKARRGVQFSKR